MALRLSPYPAIAGFSPALRSPWLGARWYNHEPKHRNLRFVSSAARHAGKDVAIFTQRICIYEQARAKHPARWSHGIRNWSLPR